MRKKTAPKENKTLGLTPSVPWRVCKVKTLEHYRLQVQFVDGLEGYVDLLPLVTGKNAGVFSVLRDTKLFDQVYLDHGAVVWPGELDLAPDAMYDVIKEHGVWILK
jgi:hypothetical protein